MPPRAPILQRRSQRAQRQRDQEGLELEGGADQHQGGMAGSHGQGDHRDPARPQLGRQDPDQGDHQHAERRVLQVDPRSSCDRGRHTPHRDQGVERGSESGRAYRGQVEGMSKSMTVGQGPRYQVLPTTGPGAHGRPGYVRQRTRRAAPAPPPVVNLWGRPNLSVTGLGTSSCLSFYPERLGDFAEVGEGIGPDGLKSRRQR